MFIFFHIFGHEIQHHVAVDGCIDVKLAEKIVRRDFCNISRIVLLFNNKNNNLYSI
jgi:hypothetical protein